MDQIPKSAPKKAIGAGLGAAALAALALALAHLPADEGKRNVGYADIGGVPTICFGHTGPDVRVGQRDTDAQCKVLLTDDAQAHLRGVLGCVPGLADRTNQLAASTRLAFNIGVGNFCKSTAAKLFKAGQWVSGCNAFLRWDMVNGKMVPGLLARRKREQSECLEGLS